MRVTEIVEVPARKEERHKHTICDMCKNIIPRVYEYDVDKVIVKVEVRRARGSNYPSGGSADVIEPDICPRCFDEKIAPFLAENGVDIQPHREEW